MRKSILVLGFVLGLSLVGSLKAQLTVRSGNVTFTVGGNAIRWEKNELPSVQGGDILRLINPGDRVSNMGVSLVCDDNKLSLGKSDKQLNNVYAVNLYSNGVKVMSDSRYKANIANLTPALNKVMQMRPVRFDYRKEKDGDIDSALMNRMGLIAQELEAVVPEVVYYSETDDIYSVDYVSLIPLLIKTAQEQQASIEAQQVIIEEQQAQIEELQTLVLSSEETTASAHRQNSRETAANIDASTQNNAIATAPAVTINENKLWGNTPNPFKQETHIRYALANNVQNAQLCIYNLTGEQIACHRLSERGQNDFTLRAGSLRPGIYLYSLIADGQVVDTHRMVVTE